MVVHTGQSPPVTHKVTFEQKPEERMSQMEEKANIISMMFLTLGERIFFFFFFNFIVGLCCGVGDSVTLMSQKSLLCDSETSGTCAVAAAADSLRD